jgi:hypothetical protein
MQTHQQPHFYFYTTTPKNVWVDISTYQGWFWQILIALLNILNEIIGWPTQYFSPLSQNFVLPPLKLT